MRLVIDMNLSPDWEPLLKSHGWETSHWSRIGPSNAPDTDIMRWACENCHVVITQDLDFSQLLFMTGASGPSVVLLRMDNEFEEAARAHVCSALALAKSALEKGALLTIAGSRVRLRTLPIGSKAL